MIYLLEDDNSIRELVTYSLNNSGLETRGFEKPSDFWRGMEQEQPDLVLMDIRMPVMDGLEATRKIRNLDRTDARAIPIIALTANAFDEDIKKSAQCGMNGHLTKPIDIRQIRKVLKAVLSKR